ncbi:amino acid adenylation domain-containing protein [Burkholderia alba]|uniref:amino acid adenylation domain-containing protein n=1 Tax=Burkholderia alba TaxID=2683677 RepID=UPI002B0617A1|nr:amino acid adenylation domain-containing protein [Burkholderia alba]
MLPDHASSAWNQTAVEFDRTRGFHHLFESMARAQPEAPALADGERTLGYAQLEADSARLAAWLVQHGAGPGARIGIFMARSIDLVVAMLAIAKTGGAYIPLDPSYPEQRLRDMAEDSGTRLIVTQQALAARAEALLVGQGQCLPLDAQAERIAACVPYRGARELEEGALAYVIYTSGSTGRPKGVMVGHLALSNFLQSMAVTPGITCDDVLLAVTTHSFDISGLELLLPLVSGARCHLCPADVAPDANRLLALMRQVAPTLMQATPATWTMLMHAGWSNPTQIRILCGGEPLPDTLKQFFDRTSRDVWNMYGPTETTIWSTTGRLEAGRPVTIGRPIANTRIYIVRETGGLSEVGEPGELCIAGLGLAHGYLNQPELSAEKFIANPYEAHGRLYRTGDLAHWQADGTIMHLGRIDNQVKIRGHRIEIGAIEAQLDQHPEVRQAVVVAREHFGGGQLVAYCTARSSGPAPALSADALREWVAARLPAYMVPVFFIETDAIPLTPAGKIDRKALGARPVSAATSAAARTAGDDAVERFVIEQWQRLLGVTDVAADTHFRDIGGDSVVAIQFVTNLNQAFGCALEVGDLRDRQSPARIARRVAEVLAGAGAGLDAPDQARAPADDDAPAPRRAAARAASGPEAGAARGTHHDIAIVGMAGRFPGAPTLDAFWANLRDGRNSVSALAAERADLPGTAGVAGARYAAEWAGLIDGVFEFDPAFFRIAPREAELMDPQQRLMLLYTWRALEDAGIAPAVLGERRTGVFVAAAQNNYALQAARATGNKGYLATGQSASMIPNRISHALDLFGPSECIEATCSSSLVALHRAARAIRAGECEQAVVGGVNLLHEPDLFESYAAMGLLTPDAVTRSFRRDGRGYVRAEGIGVMIVKPLEQALADRDTIHAVVKGSSVNHGGNTASLTTPSAAGIAAALRDAVADSGVAIGTIDYFEAHGTGAPAGDELELGALRAAVEQLDGETPAAGRREHPRAVGGLKPCIGHAEIASGMAALFKVVMAMRHGLLPGVPGVDEAEAAARWPGPGWRIGAANRAWPSVGDAARAGAMPPRRAGINSYGFGVNAHVILEAPDALPVSLEVQQAGAAPERTAQLVRLSARTPRQLERVVASLAAWLREHHEVDLARLAHTLHVGRQALPVRLAFVVDSVADLLARLDQAAELLGAPDEQLAARLAALEGATYAVARPAEAGLAALTVLPGHGDPAAQARAWVNGAAAAAGRLADGPARLSLPAYPFQLDEYRVDAAVASRPLPSAVARAEGVEVATPAAAAPRAKRICVVGAGPGGLVMAKSLLEEGHQPVVYEAAATFGGVWNLERVKTVGTYSTTRFQNSRDTSLFSDFHPGETAGMFPSVQEVRAYLGAYAARFDLERHVACGVTVTAVREAGSCWEVDSVTAQGDRRTERFDGVALCHGRYRLPQRLSIAGLDGFPGERLHAGQYFDSAPFAGKRVLVIGNGVSGMDIATEASKVAASVVWSIRSRKFILPRMVGFLPNDFVSPASLLLPERMRTQRNLERLSRALPAFDDAFARSGMRPSLAEFRANPFIHVNDEVVELVASGRIRTVFGEIDRFEGRTCHYRDGLPPVSDIDVVVECSGYRTEAMWQYLEGIEPQRDFALGLFHRRNPMLVNQYGLQEIGVIGTFPYLEMVARWYAQVVSGKYVLSADELGERADTGQIVMGPLASVVIGAKLGLVPDPRVEFKAFWQLLSLPCFPAQYRLRGPHASAEAAAVVEASRRRAFVDGEAQDPELRVLKLRVLAGLGAAVLADLLARGEITRPDYEGALARLDDSLVIDWHSQFLSPTRRDQAEPAVAGRPEGGPAAADVAIQAEYQSLLDKLKRRVIDADGLLAELQKLSRVA